MREQEIRPRELLEHYFELSARDSERFFDKIVRENLPCVACNGEDSIFQFKKNTFEYRLCSDCGTLYQTPRPPSDAFNQFYRGSESARYWNDRFFPAVAEIRRKKIYIPRVEKLFEFFKKRNITVTRMIDIGAGFGIFLEELERRFPEVESIAVEPSSTLAKKCREKGFRVKETVAERVTDLDGYADVVVCFEVFEHISDPLYFINTLKKMARPGGYILISTLCIDGFDLQMLWEKSTQIRPPHHINFLSIRGFEHLYNRAGFIDIEIFTPGQLDVDIVRNASNNEGSLLSNHRFIKSVLENEKSAKAFQIFLSKNRLSSHAWVIGKKPEQKKSNE